MLPSRDRGERYFMGKRVKIRTGSPTEVGARVQGSDLYSVALKWSDGKLSAGCDCPFFEEHGNLCKHIWATILEAWEQGHLGEVTAGSAESESGGSGPEEGTVYPHRCEVEMLDRLEQVRQIQPVTRISPPVRPPAWKEHLSRIAQMSAPPIRTNLPSWPPLSELVYILEDSKSKTVGSLSLTIASRGRTKEGELRSIPKPCPMFHGRIPLLPLQEDREILSQLIGAAPYQSYGYYDNHDRGLDNFSLTVLMAQTMLPRVVRTGRCFLPFTTEEIDKPPLAWDDGEPWRFVLEVRGSRQNKWQLTGDFRRGEQRIAINEPLLVIPGAVLVMPDCVSRVADDETGAWIAALRKNGSMVIPDEDREEFLGTLLCSATLPEIDLPEEWGYQEVLVPSKAMPEDFSA